MDNLVGREAAAKISIIANDVEHREPFCCLPEPNAYWVTYLVPDGKWTIKFRHPERCVFLREINIIFRCVDESKIQWLWTRQIEDYLAVPEPA